MRAFITDEQRFLLLANGRESLDNPDFDPAPVVKLFTPDAGATWLLTEIDPDDHDHAFNLCDLGLGMPELGWVSLQELATVRGRLGLPIERDLHFRAEKRLSAYARDARRAGQIVVEPKASAPSKGRRAHSSITPTSLQNGATSLELRQVPQVIPLGAVPVSRQVHIIDEMHIRAPRPRVVGCFHSRLETGFFKTDEIRHEGARNRPRCTDCFRLFLSHLHIFNVIAVCAVANCRNAEICHIPPYC
ncbi:hypothetical protein DFLDMN_000599 [Cupriavidus sp. H19C3]